MRQFVPGTRAPPAIRPQPCIDRESRAYAAPGGLCYPPRGGQRHGPRGDRQDMSIRRPSAATVIALLVTLAIGTQTGVAASSRDRSPDPISAIQVAGADGTSVTLSWSSRRRDERDLAGYGIFVNAVHRADVPRDSVNRIDGGVSLTVSGLNCGTGYAVGIDAYDDAETGRNKRRRPPRPPPARIERLRPLRAVSARWPCRRRR